MFSVTGVSVGSTSYGAFSVWTLHVLKILVFVFFRYCRKKKPLKDVALRLQATPILLASTSLGVQKYRVVKVKISTPFLLVTGQDCSFTFLICAGCGFTPSCWKMPDILGKDVVLNAAFVLQSKCTFLHLCCLHRSVNDLYKRLWCSSGLVLDVM